MINSLMVRRWWSLFRSAADVLLVGRPGLLRRIWNHLFTSEYRKTALVVIWGRHSADWLDALAPNAPVWRDLRNVGAVVVRSAEDLESAQNSGPANVLTSAITPATTSAAEHAAADTVTPTIARSVTPTAANTSANARTIINATALLPPPLRFGRRVIVIPLMEPHILGRPREFVSLIGPDEAVRVLSDKARFADHCRRRGLAHIVPALYPNFGDARFPCVLKRTDLNNGQGVEIVESAEQGRRLLETPLFVGHDWIIQEHVRFLTDYTIHCVCVAGRIRWHVAYAFVLNAHCIRMGDIGQLRPAVMPPHIASVLESILVPLNYSGPCNVDCTWDTADSTGRFTVFEINPRLGGSLMRPQNVTDLAACLSVIVTEALKLPSPSSDSGALASAHSSPSSLDEISVAQ